MGVKKRVQKKSILKKEVEEIVPVSTKISNFFSQKAKQILALLTVFIVVGISLLLIRSYLSSKETKAMALFSEAYKYYSQAVDKGDVSLYQNASIKFNDVSIKFPGASVGKISLFYLGNCYYFLQDYNNAEKYFLMYIDKSSKRDSFFRKLSYEGLGYAAEQSAKFEQAIKYFEKAYAADSGSYQIIDVELINLARVYEEMKHNDKAVEIYQKIIKDYPQSDYITFAKGKIFALKTNQTK